VEHAVRRDQVGGTTRNTRSRRATRPRVGCFVDQELWLAAAERALEPYSLPVFGCYSGVMVPNRLLALTWGVAMAMVLVTAYLLLFG
jgi:hypothetical protein